MKTRAAGIKLGEVGRKERRGNMRVPVGEEKIEGGSERKNQKRRG